MATSHPRRAHTGPGFGSLAQSWNRPGSIDCRQAPVLRSGAPPRAGRGARAPRFPLAPPPAQQGLAGHHPCGVAREHAQQLVPGRGQRHQDPGHWQVPARPRRRRDGSVDSELAVVSCYFHKNAYITHEQSTNVDCERVSSWCRLMQSQRRAPGSAGAGVPRGAGDADVRRRGLGASRWRGRRVGSTCAGTRATTDASRARPAKWRSGDGTSRNRHDERPQRTKRRFAARRSRGRGGAGTHRRGGRVRVTGREPGAGSREPGAGSREPGAGSREPGAGSREPGAGSREPGAGSREPGAGSREPGAGSREPGAGSREPGAGSREPGAGSREPGAGSREPGAGSREPGAGSREPGAGSREPGAGSREPGAGSREPGAGSREPGAGSREPGAGSREPGAGSREPGAGSREPGAGSREPGAGSREPGSHQCTTAPGSPALSPLSPSRTSSPPESSPPAPSPSPSPKRHPSPSSRPPRAGRHSPGASTPHRRGHARAPAKRRRGLPAMDDSGQWSQRARHAKRRGQGAFAAWAAGSLAGAPERAAGGGWLSPPRSSRSPCSGAPSLRGVRPRGFLVPRPAGRAGAGRARAGADRSPPELELDSFGTGSG